MAKEETPKASPILVVEFTAEQKEIIALKGHIDGLESIIVDLNEQLSKAEKPSLETVQANLKKVGLNAVTHRGEVKSSTIGSLNGVPIHELTDEQLDELEDLEILQDIED